MRHGSLSAADCRTESVDHVVGGYRARWRFIDYFVQTIRGEKLSDRLQVRYDYARKSVVRQYPIEFRERLADFMSVEVFNTMGRPKRVDIAARDRSHVRDRSNQIWLAGGVQIDA